MGLLGRHGRFTAGYKQGQATVRIRFGPNPTDQRSFVIQVGADQIRTPENEGSRGR